MCIASSLGSPQPRFGCCHSYLLGFFRDVSFALIQHLGPLPSVSEGLAFLLAHMPYWHASEVYPSYHLFVGACLCVCSSNAQCQIASFNASQSTV